MYSTILTELGIAVFDNEKCLKTFAFEKPAEEYVSVKKSESKLGEIGKFLGNGEVTLVNDRGLLEIFKKKSIDAQLMDDEQMDKNCILYTSDAAEEKASVSLGSRLLLNKKTKTRSY